MTTGPKVGTAEDGAAATTSAGNAPETEPPTLVDATTEEPDGATESGQSEESDESINASIDLSDGNMAEPGETGAGSGEDTGSGSDGESDSSAIGATGDDGEAGGTSDGTGSDSDNGDVGGSSDGSDSSGES